MESVRELDQDDADVVGHRQEHLPDVLGLLFLVAVGAELGQLGDAVHELHDLRPEPLLDVRDGEVRVLGNVVEDRRGNGHGVDAELGEDLGRGQRMGDVCLAGDAALPVMGLRGELEGTPQRLEIRLRVMAGYGLAELAEATLGAGQDGQPEADPFRQGQSAGAPARRRLGLFGQVGFDRHRFESISHVAGDRPHRGVPPGTRRRGDGAARH